MPLSSYEAPLTIITREVASVAGASAAYIVGSRARGTSGPAGDYDVIVVLKTQLVLLYLPKLKMISARLSSMLGSKVDVNPLPTFRLNRARGSLFLMKAKDEAKLLCGNDVLREANTGDYRDIATDWYFSIFSSLLKDVLVAYESKEDDTRVLARKIASTLAWLARHSHQSLFKLVDRYQSEFSRLALATEAPWFDVKEHMITFFGELAQTLLRADPTDLREQTQALMKANKGKSVIKNLEYGVLLLSIRREFVSPTRIFSRTLIQDRYRAALVLLIGAVSKEGHDAELTLMAHTIMKGCLRFQRRNVKKIVGPLELWRELANAISSYWSLAQPVMGL